MGLMLGDMDNGVRMHETLLKALYARWENDGSDDNDGMHCRRDHSIRNGKMSNAPEIWIGQQQPQKQHRAYLDNDRKSVADFCLPVLCTISPAWPPQHQPPP